jgi:hypothetical protein
VMTDTSYVCSMEYAVLGARGENGRCDRLGGLIRACLGIRSKWVVLSTLTN